MAARVAIALYDGASLPVTGATPSFAVYATASGIARTPPALVNLGLGLYGFQPSDADVAAGTVYLVASGAAGAPDPAVYPWRQAGSISAATDPIAVFELEDGSGTPWTGAAPTVGAYCDFSGTVRTPPGLTTVAGAYLFAMRPSVADLALGVAWRIDAPTDAYPAFQTGSFYPETVNLPGAFSALPAHDLATFLSGPTSLPTPPGGTLTFTYGAGGNLLVGPVRATDETVANLLVTVLQTGGPAPQPFLESGGASWKIARVQVTVRASLDAFELGQAAAVALSTRAHLAAVPGYTQTAIEESVPNYLGSDERGLHRWTFSVEMQWKA